MKRNVFLGLSLALLVAIGANAQVSTTPEVPRNYKPEPQPLLPMPEPLTEEMVFPVLGKDELTNKNGDVSDITVSGDMENKGIVWVNGMKQGKFKAYLRESPATYKIPSQATLKNDEEESNSSVDATIENKTTAHKSGKSISGGTMIFDKDANKMYINLGKKYNETEPAKAFPEMEESAMASQTDQSAEAPTHAKKKSSKKPVHNGVTYMGSKTSSPNPTPLAPEPASGQ